MPFMIADKQLGFSRAAVNSQFKYIETVQLPIPPPQPRVQDGLINSNSKYYTVYINLDNKPPTIPLLPF